jgi:hypothetical protein
MTSLLPTPNGEEPKDPTRDPGALAKRAGPRAGRVSRGLRADGRSRPDGCGRCRQRHAESQRRSSSCPISDHVRRFEQRLSNRPTQKPTCLRASGLYVLVGGARGTYYARW